MRNSRPFHIKLFVNNQILAVILNVQLVVNFAKILGGKAFTALGFFVYHKLKFREHCLTVKGCAELLKEIVHEISAALFVRAVLQKVLHKQTFVAG